MKFEIHGEDKEERESKNKFKIEEENKGTFKVHKKFDIESAEEATLEWFAQENANDCGPCLLLNALQVLDIDTPHKSVEAVRSAVNELRQERGEEQLDENDWFTNRDVRRYFGEIAGLHVKEFPVYPYKKDNIRNMVAEDISEEPIDLIYSTDGRHFRAVTPGGLLLDSLKNGPAEVSDQEIQEIIQNNIEASSSERYEFIGLVSKHEEPGIEVVS